MQLTLELVDRKLLSLKKNILNKLNNFLSPKQLNFCQSFIYEKLNQQILTQEPSELTTFYLQTSETFSISSFWNSVISRNGFKVWLITHEIKKGYVSLHETDFIDFSFKFFQRCLKDKSCRNTEFRLFCSVFFKLMKRLYTFCWELDLSFCTVFHYFFVLNIKLRQVGIDKGP